MSKLILSMCLLMLVGCGAENSDYTPNNIPNHIKALNECVDGCDVCDDYENCINECEYVSQRYEAVLNSEEKVVINYKNINITPSLNVNNSEYKCEIYPYTCETNVTLYMCDIQY